VADAFLLLRNGIDAGLQCFSPAQSGVDQIILANNPRSLGAPNNNGFQLLGAHHRAQTMSRRVVIIVDKHGSANKIFTRRANTTDTRVLATRFPAQYFFGVSDAFAPNFAGIAQLHFVFADVKIGRLLSSAGDDDAIITGGFQRSSEVTAGGGAAESVARRRTEIDKARLGSTWCQPRPGNRTGHADNDVFRVVGVDVQWQLIEQHVFGEELSTPILAEDRLFGEIQIGKFPLVEIDAQYFPHVAAR
jgi:hypothetical protein